MIHFVMHAYKMKMAELFHTIVCIRGITPRLPEKRESGDAPKYLLVYDGMFPHEAENEGVS